VLAYDHRVEPRHDRPPDAADFIGTVGAGLREVVRVEFTPTSADGRFGVFQFYVEGFPLGDATTTALYPHHVDLRRLGELAAQDGNRPREPLVLGDTFDHLNLDWELTPARVVFDVATRPEFEWGTPPPWAPAVGGRLRLSVARQVFIDVCREVEPRFGLWLANCP
jgi:hypothetical protein